MSFFGSRRQADGTPTTEPQSLTAMETPPQHQSPVGFETVLGANSSIEGTLTSSANIRLDGTFIGTLEITGNVLVGETAKIEADLNARNISIAGAVRGNITGKKVQVLRTGRVWGDINATALTTEEGAFITGKITMISPDSNLSPEDMLDLDADTFAENRHQGEDETEDIFTAEVVTADEATPDENPPEVDETVNPFKPANADQPITDSPLDEHDRGNGLPPN